MNADAPNPVPSAEADDLEYRLARYRLPLVRRFGLIVAFLHARHPGSELEHHVPLRQHPVVRGVLITIAILAWMILFGWFFSPTYWRF